MLPKPTADAPQVSAPRCWASRSRSRTTSTSPGCRPVRHDLRRRARRPRTPRWCADCGRRARSSSARPTPANSASGRSPADPDSATPESLVAPNTLRAGRRAAARPRSPRGWSPRRSDPTAQAACGSPPPGRTSSASNRSAAASRPGRCRRRSTASPSTACWPARSPTPRWCSTRRRATPKATSTSRRRYGVRLRRHAPGPLRIAMSTTFPVHGFPRQPAPGDPRPPWSGRRATADLGHTVMAGNPNYGLRLSWNFLSRSTSGLLDWADRLGPASRWTHAPRPICGWAGCSRSARCARQGRTRPQIQRRVGSIFGVVDVVLAPTTALPPPRCTTFDKLRRPGHRPRDDRGLPGDLAVESCWVGRPSTSRPGSPPTDCRSACS